MEHLDEYAQCAFATCNWALTSLNKKEDLLDNVGVKESGGTFTVALEEYEEFLEKKDKYTNEINRLRGIITSGTPQRGVPVDDIAR